ncbi:MAG: hypothetical protein ACN6N1_13825, partial [Acinetobacter guillouiae]
GAKAAGENAIAIGNVSADAINSIAIGNNNSLSNSASSVYGLSVEIVLIKHTY